MSAIESFLGARWVEETLTGTGIWTAPANMIGVVYVTGCGGGGGGALHTTVAAAGGGGAGASAVDLPVAIMPGEDVDYEVGVGGLGRTTSDGPGTAGGYTAFGRKLRLNGGYLGAHSLSEYSGGNGGNVHYSLIGYDPNSGFLSGGDTRAGRHAAASPHGHLLSGAGGTSGGSYSGTTYDSYTSPNTYMSGTCSAAGGGAGGASAFAPATDGGANDVVVPKAGVGAGGGGSRGSSGAGGDGGDGLLKIRYQIGGAI